MTSVSGVIGQKRSGGEGGGAQRREVKLIIGLRPQVGDEVERADRGCTHVIPVSVRVGRQVAASFHDKHARVTNLAGAWFVWMCLEATLESILVALTVGEARTRRLDETNTTSGLRSILGLLSAHVRHLGCD